MNLKHPLTRLLGSFSRILRVCKKRLSDGRTSSGSTHTATHVSCAEVREESRFLPAALSVSFPSSVTVRVKESSYDLVLIEAYIVQLCCHGASSDWATHTHTSYLYLCVTATLLNSHEGVHRDSDVTDNSKN